MPKYINHSATLTCTHGGRVVLIPPPVRSLQIMRSPVVTDQDLLAATILGCPQIGPGLKPCTKVVNILVGKGIMIKVDQQIPLLDSLQALTDGVAPGIVSVLLNPVSNATPVGVSAQADTLANAAQHGAPFCELCK